MSEEDIKTQIAEKIVGLFLKKIINATSRDILLGQLRQSHIGDPNFEMMNVIVKDEKFMSHYDDFIKEILEDNYGRS
jgi:hypothetical protein